MLNCTPQSVLNLHHRGIIPAKVSEGRLIRFDRAEVLAALEARSKKEGA